VPTCALPVPYPCPTRAQPVARTVPDTADIRYAPVTKPLRQDQLMGVRKLPVDTCRTTVRLVAQSPHHMRINSRETD
jgi:hypothetical protein